MAFLLFDAVDDSHCNALQLRPILPLTEARGIAMHEAGRRELPMLAYKLSETPRQALELRERIIASPSRYLGLDGDLQRLMSPDFLAHLSQAQLPHLRRYLRAIQIRAERAAVLPAKDAEKAKQLAPFRRWKSMVPPEQHETVRSLLEEFRVSFFAQELGTAHLVSAQHLRAFGDFPVG